MAVLMATRIIEGKNDYLEVVTKRPDLKDGIDTHLFIEGKQDLIVKIP